MTKCFRIILPWLNRSVYIVLYIIVNPNYAWISVSKILICFCYYLFSTVSIDSMSRTGLTFNNNNECHKHPLGEAHVDNPTRCSSVMRQLEETGIKDKCVQIKTRYDISCRVKQYDLCEVNGW